MAAATTRSAAPGRKPGSGAAPVSPLVSTSRMPTANSTTQKSAFRARVGMRLASQ
jgi:hypothetical protein